MDHAEEDVDHAPFPSLLAEIARATVAAVLISVAAWMLAGYVLETLGVPFLSK